MLKLITITDLQQYKDNKEKQYRLPLPNRKIALLGFTNPMSTNVQSDSQQSAQITKRVITPVINYSMAGRYWLVTILRFLGWPVMAPIVP